MKTRLLAISLMLPLELMAATIVVDRTALGGTVCGASANDCSLTGAISAANQNPTEDTIVFNIPMTDPGCNAATGVCRIDVGPVASFPAITSELTIDGYTQPGAAPNTEPAPGANNARLKIELTSSTPAPSSVLWFVPSRTLLRLRGLALFLPGPAGMVGGFQTARIDLRGNWFGVTAAGTSPDYSTSSGAIEFGSFGTGAIIGGPDPADRNVIAGSGRNGSGQLQGTGNTVRVSSTASGQGVLLFQGNLVGLAPDGVTPLPFRDPLTISSSDDAFVTPDIRVLDNRFVRPALTAGGNFGNALQFSVSRVMDHTALIQGNVFGLGVDGSPIGVELHAISISVGNSSRFPRIRIGGLLTHEGNTFSSSFDLPGGGRGNAISWGFTPNDSRVEVVGNRMLGSEALGFDLPGPLNARTLNDPGDPDSGANRLQNFPEISAFAITGNQVELSYRVDSTTANSVYPLRVDFYRAAGDEGDRLIGSDTYEAGSAQSVKSIILTPTLPLAPGDVVVGIATDAEGRSSEFGFYRIQSLAILSDTPDPAPAGVPYTVTVRAEAAPGEPFAPNGRVRISDGRGASCRATLTPTATAGRSEGSCEMLTTGAAGTVTLTAALSASESAFALANGASVANATASHTVSAGLTTLERVSGDAQATPLGSAFAAPLVVRALGAGGAPIAGVRVDFAGPASGPGAALSPTSAISGPDGIASTTATAIRAGGGYAVTARVGTFTQTFSLTNEPGLDTALAIVSNLPNPSNPGQAVTVSTALNPESGGPAPTGSIAVSANTGEACSIVLPATSCALNFATLGERMIQAFYPGDATYTSSKAAFATQTVQPPPSLRIDAVSQTEGNSGTGTLTFTVTLDNPLGGAVSVNYTTANDTATAPGDYAATNGTLNFSGAITTQAIAVTVNGDTEIETDEQFVVNLSGASGATIADGQGIGIILNDDLPPPLVASVGDVVVQEPVSSGLTEALARFSVSLDRPASAPASVRVRTFAGTATSPGDFDSNDLVLEFAPGERVQTVEVWVNDDELAEGSESFALQLSEPQGLTIGDGEGVGTILDGGAAATILVTSAGDPGDGQCTPAECTLREAIALGNSLELVGIGFAIPGALPHVIRPLTPLPVPGRPIHTIDGYTQPGSSRGSPVEDLAMATLDNLIGIELDGSALGVGSTGLNLIYGATVRGLAIHSWRGAGLRLTLRADGRPMVIAGNYIGTDASGQLARGNGVGIEVFPEALVQGASMSWQIGNRTPGVFASFLRADNCNLVSANLGSGIRVVGGVATDTDAGLLTCNRIGLARDGTPLGNGGHGLEILAPTSASAHGLVAVFNLIGSNALDGIAIRSLQPGTAGVGRIGLALNAIGIADGAPRHNGGHAVSIGSETLGVQAVEIIASTIDHANGPAVRILGADTRASVWGSLPATSVPIDLGPAGATPNDTGDPDTGPNELLNAPELLSAEFNDAGNRMRVRYQLDTQGLRPRVVRFYAQIEGRLESLGEQRYPGGVASVELPASRGFERLAEGTEIVAQTLIPTALIASEISATPVLLSSRQAVATAAPVREGGGAQARFTVSLEPAVTGNTALSYRTVDGSATAGSDYQSSSGTLTLTPGSPQATVDVPILNDSVIEADESFTLEVWSETSFSIGTAQAAATIVDEDRLRQDRGQYDPLDLDSLNGIEGFRIEHPRSGDAALIDLGNFNGSGGSDLALGLATSAGICPFNSGCNPSSIHLLPDLVVPANGVVVLPAEGSAQFPRIVDDLQRGSGLAPVTLAGFRGAGQLPTLGLRGASRTLLLHGRAAPFAASSNLSALLAPPLAETISGASGGVLDIGDFNGDGRRDMAITTSNFAAYVLFGTPSGVPASLGQLNGSNGFRLQALFGEPIFGVVPVGDLTGDGRSDLIVRIRFDGRGRNYFVPGRNGAVGPVNTEGRIFDPFDGGLALMTGRTGDLDGDGQRDLVLTSADLSGQVRTFVLFNCGGIFCGARRSEVREAFPGDRASEGIAILDLDGNGIDDLALGMAGSDLPNTAAGQVAVLYGRNNWPAVVDLAAPPAQMVKTLGSRQGARMGWRLAPVSDLNGDGRAELAVTAPQAGRSYVLYSNDGIFNGGSETPPAAVSARSVYRSRDESAEIRLAQQVELIAAGDVDGDGRADLLAGNPESVVTCPRAGCGSPAATSGALALLPGRVAQAQSGVIDLQRPPAGTTRWRRSEQPAVPLTGFYAPAGDFTGDGLADLAFLTVDGAALGVVAGRAAFPAFLDPIAEAQRRGRRYALDAADGLRVASLGDIDGDGFGDLGVLRGAPAARQIELLYGTASGSPRRGALVAPAALQPLSLARVPGLGRIRGAANPDSFEVILGDGRRAIVFGSPSLPASLDLRALGGQGMYLTAAQGLTGDTAILAALGDMDADGMADLGVAHAPPAKDGVAESRVEILRGRSNWPASIDLATTNPALIAGRLLLRGDGVGAIAGLSALRDRNGDGRRELLVSLFGAEGHASGSGKAFLLHAPLLPGGAQSVALVNDEVAPGQGVTLRHGRFAGGRWALLRVLGDIDGDGLEEILYGSDPGDQDQRIGRGGSAGVIRGAALP